MNQKPNAQPKNAKKPKVSKPKANKLQNPPTFKQEGPRRSVAVATTMTTRTRGPKVVTLRNGDTRVQHREYITDVTAGSGAASPFNLQSYPVNPGQSTVFPWLSKLAHNFESYRFRKLRFIYETEAPSSLGGSLILAVDYDASDSPPINKQQALAYRESVRSAPWTECCHTSLVEDLSKLKSHYVRAGVQPTNTDIKTYDVGNLFVITQGVTTSGAVCGELYVEYDVELLTPIYESVFAQTSTVLASAPASGAPFDPLSIVLGGLVSSVTLSSGTSLFSLAGLQPGQEISVNVALVGTGISSITVAAPVGLTLKTNILVVNTGATMAVAFITYTVPVVLSSNVARSFEVSCIATTLTFAQAVVTAVPPSGF